MPKSDRQTAEIWKSLHANTHGSVRRVSREQSIRRQYTEVVVATAAATIAIAKSIIRRRVR